MYLKDICDWIKKQTKLKIDLCKITVLIIIVGGIGYLLFFLLDRLYFPYFESVISFDNGKIALISQPNEGANLIGDWGTFGDFIGGTLNPLLTFISICLILYTVYQNKKALEFNSQELSLSRLAHQDSAAAQIELQEASKLQQVDNLFLNLITSLQYRQQEVDQLSSQLKDTYLKGLCCINM